MATPIIGASGTVVVGTTVLVTFEYGLVPTAFTACTRNRYCVPLANAVIVSVVAGDAKIHGRSGKYPM